MQADHTERMQLLANRLEDQSAAEQSAPKYTTMESQIR